MTTPAYDAHGFYSAAPVPRDEWRARCPDQPDGVILTAGVAPPGLLVIENYLGRQMCDDLTADCEATEGVPCTVYNPKEGEGVTYRETAERISENVPLEKLRVDVVLLVRNAFGGVIAPHYRKPLRSFERPEILRYRQGGRYIPHADAESWNRQRLRWDRSLDRDLSLLLYFNDGYEGGALVFPNFGFGFTPKKGMLVAFPSDHRYVHAAEPVTAGVRYAIVSWAAATSGPRVETAPRASVISF